MEKKQELMYITNDIQDVLQIEKAGVDIVFIDLEINGKKERQGHLDTVISNHKLEDIKKIRSVVKKAKILTRINPLNKESENEIDKAIEYGTNIIMLPMFKTMEEVKKFIEIVNSRVETCLLLETAEAYCRIDKILELSGIDRIHIGLNDLHLGLGLDFMFECLSLGLLDNLSTKILKKNIVFGFGGIAKIGEGDLPAELIIREHARMESTMVILSRAFKKNSIDLKNEVEKIRKEYSYSQKLSEDDLEKNKKTLSNLVDVILKKRKLT